MDWSEVAISTLGLVLRKGESFVQIIDAPLLVSVFSIVLQSYLKPSAFTAL